MPQFDHVFVLVEENTNYSSVVGSASMPYFNSLANQYGLATNFYANTHPSIGNYFVMTTGEVVTNDNNFDCAVTVNNLVRRLVAAGKTWRVYAESLPSVGYTGGDVFPYAKRHNPFAYFSDVLNSSAQKQNIVPFSQLASDMSSGTLPNFAFIIPNLQSDMHDCPPGMTTCTLNDKLAYGDQWLQNNIGPLISNPAFQQDGLLIITFDEASDSDSANGGGKIATLLVSPKVKPGFRSTTFYQHEHLLRTVMAALGMNTFMGAAKYAAHMAEFFQSGGSGSTLSGKVTSAVDGRAISGVTVSYSGGTTTTSTAGNYNFATVAAGTYAVAATKSGWGKVTNNVTVSADTPAALNFQLATSGQIKGAVTNSSGGAIAGATITLTGGVLNTNKSLSTSSTGAYSSGWIPVGNYTVTAQSGSLSKTQNVTLSTGQTLTVNFTLP
jgi:phosphatidylinositol-3-phosphatase